MVDDITREGISAYKSGDKRRARRLLGQAVNQDKDNAMAWWYLSLVLDTTEQKVHSLKQVLRIEPDYKEAQKTLEKLLQRQANVTPPDGVVRPVLDVRENTQGNLVTVPEHVAVNETATAQRRDSTIALVAVGITLAAIVITVILIWTGAASGALGIQGPELDPTAQVIGFGVPACIVSERDVAELIFINNSPVPIDVYRGSVGQELYLLSISPDDQGRIERQDGGTNRFSVEVQESGYAGSGARIDVPVGNVCRVPIG